MKIKVKFDLFYVIIRLRTASIFCLVMIKPLHIALDESIIIDSAASLLREEELAVASTVQLDAMDTQLVYERKLFIAVAHGSESAFRELFQIYSPLFSYIIHKVTGEEMLIPDFLQDVFLKIWLKRDLLESIENPRKWVMQILYRQCFNHLKHKQVQQKHVQNIQTSGQQVNTHNAVEKILFHKETVQVLKSIIIQLPPQTQKIYRLNREEDMSIQQIADYLHLSPQTVKNTLSRGIKLIRILLKDKGILVSMLCLFMWRLF